MKYSRPKIRSTDIEKYIIGASGFGAEIYPIKLKFMPNSPLQTVGVVQK
jgi:hypothetical protein